MDRIDYIQALQKKQLEATRDTNALLAELLAETKLATDIAHRADERNRGTNPQHQEAPTFRT
jgi:hypothetical protein